MKKWISFLLAMQLLTATAFAKGKIQNEDVKSLTDIEAAVLTTTGNLTSGNACIASPGSTAGLATGLYIYDTSNPTYIPSSTTILGLPGTCSTGQIEMSANATHAATGDTLTFGGQASQLINDTKIWLTSVTPNQQLSTAITSGSIGGTAGSKNYLTTYTASTSSGTPNSGNGNFEQGSTSGWSLGTVGTLTNGLPTGSPTFGSGASGNLSISTVTGGSQIAGNYSLSYVSSAATTQGNMLASNAFYIDSEDQAKVLTVKFYYTTNSGASNNNYSGTSSNSFAWAPYDVTNSGWLSSTGNFCMTQSSGQGYCTGTLQTASNTTQIRFVLYNANATSGATTLYFDDFFVGPQTAPFGPAMNDWISYTPTVTGLSTSSSVGYYRRVGDSIEIQTYALSSGSSSTTISVSIPSTFSIDTTKIPVSNTLVGIARGNHAGTIYGAPVTAIGTTAVIASGGNNQGNWGTTTPFTWASGDTLQFYFTVPISGFSSNSSLSSDTDTRVITMKATGSTQSSVNGNVNLINPTVAFDSAGAYNSSTGVYTVPVSGYYDVVASWGASGGQSITINQFLVMALLQNGSSISPVSIVLGNGGTADQLQVILKTRVKANAGDTLQPQLQADVALTAAAVYNTFEVQRATGPSVIAATESVNATYYGSNTSIGSSTTVIFPTKLFDSHNAMNTATGVYTCPVSGKYRVSSNIYWSTGITSGAILGFAIDYNSSSALSMGGQNPNIANYRQSLFISGTVNCLAGGAINVVAANGGSAAALSGDDNSFISIERVGN